MSTTKYEERIAKLLRRAEHPNTPEAEADACVAQAQQLMSRWAIDEAVVRRRMGDDGKTVDDPIIEARIVYDGIYRQARFSIGSAVAEANDCRALITTNERTWATDPGKPKVVTVLWVVGHTSDVERVRMLDTSLQLQCATALNRWWKTAGFDGLSRMAKFRARREFIFGFATTVRERLLEARRQAVEEAEADAGQTVQPAAAKADNPAEEVALALVEKKRRVDEWYDERYGTSTRKVTRNYRRGARDAHDAGCAAGMKASLDQRRGIGGARGELDG